MRVTTGMIFDSGLASIQKQNSRLLDTQEQVATGRRILRPSDDPVASARALEVSQSKSVNSLYAANQGYANDALKLVDSKLDAATDIVTYVRTRAVESGNGTYSSREQAAIGADITQQFNALLGIANSQDSTGEFVFGGYRSNAMPFGGSLAAGVQYQGDQGPARCRSRPPATCRSPAPARRSSTPSAPARARPLRSAPPAMPVRPWSRGCPCRATTITTTWWKWAQARATRFSIPPPIRIAPRRSRRPSPPAAATRPWPSAASA
jgi:hypothetical protein